MTDEEREQFNKTKAAKLPQHSSWSTKEIEELIHYWNTLKKSSKEIGRLFNKSPGSIVSKVKRLRRAGVNMRTRSLYISKKMEEFKVRKCLKCREDFLSEGPFNKICPRCALINAGVYERSIMTFVK